MSQPLEPNPSPLESNPPFVLAPPPWQTKCDIYWLPSYGRGPLPANAYSPLEASSPTFADPAQSGDFKGGLGLVMIIRYSETPVGSYNEMIYMPGSFQVPREGAKPASRVTRIYVDQKETTYNGRLNWNLPKHLVRFTFTNLNNPARIQVQVFPPDTTATSPFFTATVKPFRWLPSFPFSSKALVINPPVPASGKDGEEELCGTDKWVRTAMAFSCKNAKLCSTDVVQPHERRGGRYCACELVA